MSNVNDLYQKQFGANIPRKTKILFKIHILIFSEFKDIIKINIIKIIIYDVSIIIIFKYIFLIKIS